MADESRGDNALNEPEGGHGVRGCSGRREFLVRVVASAGGLVLALSSAGCSGQNEQQEAEGASPGGPGGDRRGGRPGGGPGSGPRGGEVKAVQPDEVKGDEIVLKVGASSPLAKVGGSETVETSAGKIVVARTGESSFVAVSAICTHKGGPINYDGAQKQFFCPLHGSRFDLDGKVLRPPANGPLQAYAPRPEAGNTSVTVSLKPQGRA